MEVKVISEHGYVEAAFGLGLSYGKTSNIDFYDYDIDDLARQHSTMAKLAGKGNGHDKFLRMMTVYLDITAPIYWWKEFDTYKVGTVAQSESTMHTLGKRPLKNSDFQNVIDSKILEYLNITIDKYYKDTSNKSLWLNLINNLPMSFLQRRIVMCNYEVLKNIVNQRKDHKLAEWNYFIDSIRKQLSYSCFIF